MEWLAEFMGWGVFDWSKQRIENPPYGYDAWGVWMFEVEPKIREKEYWGEYIAELISVFHSNDIAALSPKTSGRTFALVLDVMSAPLEQRVEALRRVLQ